MYVHRSIYVLLLVLFFFTVDEKETLLFFARCFLCRWKYKIKRNDIQVGSLKSFHFKSITLFKWKYTSEIVTREKKYLSSFSTYHSILYMANGNRVSSQFQSLHVKDLIDLTWIYSLKFTFNRCIVCINKKSYSSKCTDGPRKKEVIRKRIYLINRIDLFLLVFTPTSSLFLSLIFSIHLLKQSKHVACYRE